MESHYKRHALNFSGLAAKPLDVLKELIRYKLLESYVKWVGLVLVMIRTLRQ